jgi:putative peptidoglycan lipid II flippase
MTASRRRSRRRVAAGIAGGAALIAAVTVVARVVGFGRWLVFSETVTDSCLGTAYSTANMLPNIVFEVVAGGALASAVVPIVGAQLAKGDDEGMRRTASALLTWTVLVLVPLAVVGVLAAGPLMRALIGTPAGCDGAAVVDVATRMFAVFAPQIPLYGLAVVCGGLLNAQRRFFAAAAAPLLSSLVVVATYVAFGVGFDGSRDQVGAIPDRWLAVLAVGTTLGVVALMLTTALPVAGQRLRLRPALRFPPGVAVQARRLAAAGLAGLVAQQLAIVVVIALVNRSGSGGALNLYNYAWAVYLLPYAVLAVPIATSAFSALSEHAGRSDTAGFARTAAATTRAVVVASALGAALLAGTADPVARTFLSGAGSAPGWQLSWALVAFAPGLVGYGLVAHLGRVLYARHAGGDAAAGTALGWLVVASLAIALVPTVPDGWEVTAVAAANSVGMLGAAAVLLVSVRRRVEPDALAGVPRALAVGTAAAAGGGLAGAAAAAVVDVDGMVANGLVAVAAALVALGGFAAVILMTDRGDLRAVLARRVGRG